MAYDFEKHVFLRDVMGAYMEQLGEKDNRVIVVNADLMGTCRNRKFCERFPERSFNVGIAEQNLVSFSAGLAHEGFIPYAFTMAPFLTMRACEQCRTDVAYGRLNVRLMGIYAGVSGGISGATHWSTEDVAIMTGIPEMTVIEPCDGIQAQKILDATLKIKGPVYIRSSVEPMASLYDESYSFELGKASVLKQGDDGVFICAGVTVKYALKAAISIEKKIGKHIRVIDMHTIKPIDKQAIIDATKTGCIVAAHDHNIYGGLGTQVAQVIAENNLSCKSVNIGIPDKFVPMAHAPYLYRKFGYDSEGLEKNMLELLRK